MPAAAAPRRRAAAARAAALVAAAAALAAAAAVFGGGLVRLGGDADALAADGPPRMGGCEWKREGELVGPCKGGMRPVAPQEPSSPLPSAKGASLASSPSLNASASAEACAAACCAAGEACGAWQWREDVGCSHAADVRLGGEKDGPAAWCEPSAPARWAGEASERFGAGGEGEGEGEGEGAAGAAECSDAGWRPGTLGAQCFGLGDARPAPAGASAAACRDACCAAARAARAAAGAAAGAAGGDAGCRTWQWRADKGCFFSGRVRCAPPADADAEERPFRGRRKVIASRAYSPPAARAYKYIL